jgi:hypothetical protein
MTALKNSGKGAGMKRQIPVCFAPFLLAGLAACADDSTPPPMFCPQVAVLQQAAKVTIFLPGRTDVAAQVTTAQITGIAGACATAQNNQLLRVTFRAGFVASDGPADRGATVQLPYFVALSRGNQIISEQDYTVALHFNGNASNAEATSKPVKVELSNVHDSQNVQILVGFKMSPAQLAYAAGHPMAAP